MPDSSSTPARPARRDGLTAVAVLGVIAAALLLGYRASPNVAAPAAVGEPATTSAAEPAVDAAAGYDLNTAMALAGQEVPAETQSYYFFAFVDEVPAEQEIGDLAEKLQQASKEHDYLGISGPDTERNRRNLLRALAASQGKDLSGVTIVYVGPAVQRDEVSAAIRTAGAQARFVAYPDPSAVLLPAPVPGAAPSL